MQGVKLLSCLLSTFVVVQARPQDFSGLMNTGTNAVSNTVGVFTDGASQLLENTLQGATRFGDELAGTAGVLVKTGVDGALMINNAVGDVSVAAVSGIREGVGALGEYGAENLRDAGRLTSGLVRGSVGTVVGATELTGRYATDMTGAIVDLMSTAGGAIGEFAGGVVENTVNFARSAGDVVGSLAEGAVVAFTGYDPNIA